MKDDKQINMFDIPEWWEDEWQDMPEFVQKDETSFHQIVVKFRNRKDLLLFMELMNQQFTKKTKSIWYPKLEIKHISHLRYI